MNSSTDYWEDYYRKNRESSGSSLFAQFITPFLQTGKRLIELGCGNAKDCTHFSNIGVKVLAIDQCKEEIKYLSEKHSDNTNLVFFPGDMTNLPELEKSDYLYSRFTIHAIDKKGEEQLLDWSAKNLNTGGLFFIEVRGVKDDLYGQGTPMPDNAFFTNHYRRFIVLDEMVQRLEDRGFSIMYKLEAKGLAPFKDRDPEVIRIIAQKS